MADVTLSRVRKAFPKKQDSDSREFHAIGRVVGINADGSCQVAINRSTIDVRCAAFADVSVGDTAIVLFTEDGRGYAIGSTGRSAPPGAIAWGDITGNMARQLDLKAALDAKQTAISDLAEIRSGASLGATALQSVPDTYRTAEAQDSIDAGKQPTITDLSEIRSGAALGATALQSETDPTVPAWAKEPTKPTYTATEVGALPSDTPIPEPTAFYATSSTAAGTAAKVATVVRGGAFTLVAGAMVAVKFSAGNSAASPT